MTWRHYRATFGREKYQALRAGTTVALQVTMKPVAELARIYLMKGLEEVQKSGEFPQNLEELCTYFASYVTADSKLESVIDDLIKERDLAQKQMRVVVEAKRVGTMAELQYIKDNYPRK